MCWSRHDETLVDQNKSFSETNDENDWNGDHDWSNDHDNISDMLHDCEDNVAEKDQEKFQQLFDESGKPLYNGCTKFTKLSGALKMFNIKATHGWSDTCFTSLLEILHEMLPEDNELSVSLYQAKILICTMVLEIKRIYACPNDYMLYRNQHADLDKCVMCSTS